MSDQSKEPEVANYDQLRKDMMGRLANKGGLRKEFKSTLELTRESKKHERESKEDLVTGLPNERALDDLLNGLNDSWERSPEDQKLNGSMIAIDLTGLKKTNDEYGRPVGNTYLKATADSITKNLRPGDRAFRLGSEADEFTIHIPNMMNEADLEGFMNRIDKSLDEKQAAVEKDYPGVKFSLSYVAVRYHLAVGPKDAFLKGHTEMKAAKKQKEEQYKERGLSIGKVII